MPKFLNRVGYIYGRLTVISLEGKNTKGKYLWNCQCTCGNFKIVSSDNLSSGKSKSCGCLKAEFLAKKGNQFGVITDREIALLNVEYHHLKKRNKLFNCNLVISFDEFRNIVKSECFYCGTGHSKEIKDRQRNPKRPELMSEHVLTCNGVDRLDSSIGYITENVVPCCTTCNFAKRTQSVEEFKIWVRKVYEKFCKEQLV